MVMSAEWIAFEEQQRQQAQGDPARVGSTPTAPGKGGWLQDVVDRVTRAISEPAPAPAPTQGMNSASRAILNNPAMQQQDTRFDQSTARTGGPDNSLQNFLSWANRGIRPLETAQNIVGEIGARSAVSSAFDPMAALNAPLAPIRETAALADLAGLDNSIAQALNLRDTIAQRMGLVGDVANAARDVGSEAGRFAAEGIVPTKPWEVAATALPAALALRRGAGLLPALGELANVPASEGRAGEALPDLMGRIRAVLENPTGERVVIPSRTPPELASRSPWGIGLQGAEDLPPPETPGTVFSQMRPNTRGPVRAPLGEEPTTPPAPIRNEPVLPGTFPGETPAAPTAPASDLMQRADESDLEYAVRLRTSGLAPDEIRSIEQANSARVGSEIDQAQRDRNAMYQTVGHDTKQVRTRAEQIAARMDAMAAEKQADRGRAAMTGLQDEVARLQAARNAAPDVAAARNAQQPRNAAGINGPGGLPPAGGPAPVPLNAAPQTQAAQQLQQAVTNPTLADKLHFFWMNNVLSGPLTQARNVMGNASMTLYRPVERAAAATTEQAAAFVQRRPAERFWQEAPAAVVGAVNGFPEGVRGALDVLRNGIGPQQALKLQTTPGNPIGGALGKVVGAPTTALSMADEFFGAINYRSALWTEATRRARMQGLRGNALQAEIARLVAAPPSDMMTKAMDAADEAVFRGDPGEQAKALSAFVRTIPGGRYVLPFVRTPANVMRYSVQSSPLGLANIGAWKKLAQSNPEGADELARSFIGSSIAAAIGTAVATGAMDITAAPPTNKNERDRFNREGKIPFAVKIGDRWIEYKQIPALSTTLTLVASAVDAVRNGKDASDIGLQTVNNIASNLFDQSYMNGLGDFIDVVSEPAVYLEGFLARQASGFVPFSGAQRQVAQVLDPTLRDPEGIVQQIEAGIPGLSDNLPPRLNAFGEETQRTFPSPLRISQEQQTAVDAELGRLGYNVGFVGDSFMSSKNEPITLTREQQVEYQQVAGQVTAQVLAKLIENPSYQAMSDEDKLKAVKSAVSKSRDRTRDALESRFAPAP